MSIPDFGSSFTIHHPENWWRTATPNGEHEFERTRAAQWVNSKRIR